MHVAYSSAGQTWGFRYRNWCAALSSWVRYYAFKRVGIELEFVGEGENEKGIDKAIGNVLIEVSPDFYRPTDVVNLWGDPTKAKAKLGWNPAKTSLEELVNIMVDSDMAKVASEGAAEKVRTNLAEYL